MRRDGKEYILKQIAYMEQWDFAHWGSIYWRKSPELLEYAKEHGFCD